MTAEVNGGNWVFYPGRERPRLNGKDSAQGLIEQALACGHPPALVWLTYGDSLRSWLLQENIPHQVLPQWLTSTRKLILDALKAPAHQQELAQIQSSMQQAGVQWGMTFYSPWIPSELFTVPDGGFINFHPGNLPELRGMEPDTWAILLGMPSIRGTVHCVTEEYDEGPILWETRPVTIHDWDTPVSLLAGVTAKFLDESQDFLLAYQHNQITPIAQAQDHGFELASFTRLKQIHCIDWHTHDHCQLNRMLRAFVGQRISLDLLAPINGDLCVVNQMELWEGQFPGIPGTLLGSYQHPGNPCHGWHVVRSLEGVALIHTTTPQARGILPPSQVPRQASFEHLQTLIASGPAS